MQLCVCADATRQRVRQVATGGALDVGRDVQGVGELRHSLGDGHIVNSLARGTFVAVSSRVQRICKAVLVSIGGGG